jgi:hypothetical protein
MRTDDLAMYVGGAVVAFGALRVFGRGMSVPALVLRSWSAATTPIDQEGHYVQIIGRRQGLWAWFLTIIGIEMTYEFRVNSRNVTVRSGAMHSIIPLTSISSFRRGYLRPWLSAIAIGCGVAFFTFVGMSLKSRGDSTSAILAAPVLGTLLGVIWYALNKRIVVGVVEYGGVIHQLAFKRSIIESKKIDERDAAEVVEIVQHLVDTRRFK